MARIKKRGLDYFPISVDFIYDRAVRRLMKREGDAVLGILLEVFSYIYSDEGYYVRADSLFYEDLSAGLYERNASDVERIVRLAVGYGLFDTGMFEKHCILTSAEIQRQYLFSTRRRNVSQLEPEYCLLEAVELSEPQVETKGKTIRKCKGDTDERVRLTNENVTLIPQNVTSGTHSIAQNSTLQHSIEQYSVAQQSTEYPLLNPPPENTGEEDEPTKMGEDERRNAIDRPVTVSPPSGKCKVWTQEDIDQLCPPTDGTDRNYEGLLVNLRLFGIPPAEQYALIRKSNYGAIGGTIWRGICVLRDSNGRIKLPGRYLLSLVNKKKPDV